MIHMSKKNENCQPIPVKNTHTMKYVLLVLLTFPSYVHSQQMERSIVSAAGKEDKTQNISLSWTLGELAVSKVSTGRIMFTEGFQQGESPANNSASTDNLVAWPNPSQDEVFVNWSKSDDHSILCLTDMNGKILIVKTISSGEINSTLDLNDLRAGIYFLTLRNAAGNISASTKICKIK
jgi:hypothetical protein